MPSMRVVPAFDEAEDLSPCGGMAVESGSIDEFTFERREEALAHGVVVAVSDGSHGGADTRLETALTEGDRGVLASLIGVVDDRVGPTLFEGHVEGSEDELGAEVILDTPTDHPSAPGIEDDCQVDVADSCWYVRDVREPELIGSRRAEVSINKIGGRPRS